MSHASSESRTHEPAVCVQQLTPAQLLEVAHESLRKQAAAGDPLADTAIHMVACAAELVDLLARRDVSTARQAMQYARASVTTATFAVWQAHDEQAGRS